MRQAGWLRLLSNDPPRYADILNAHVQYTEVERMPAFRDLMSRIRQMRDGMVADLVTGTLDKFGNSNDHAKRAVVHCLNVLLAYPPALHAQFEQVERKRTLAEKMKEARSSTAMHGGDEMIGPTNFSVLP